MPSPATDAMDTSSQYSSCETLDSHQSSEFDEKNEVNGNDGKNQRSNRKVSVEHTEYIQKERVTRAAPPKPAYNPMQFVAIKPSALYQTATEQLKKAEEIRKASAKEVNRKEEPEDWQNNLDNWKSSRRKRVEHIIDRVVEVKKLEEEEHDRNRRKSKTFNELMEERGSRRKLSTLAIYTEDDTEIDMTGLTSDVGDASDNSKINSDNHADDVDKRQPNDVQHDTKAADDAINNNGSNFHSTALIKDVIHKKPSSMHREVHVKSEVEERMTTDLTSNTYAMSVTAKTVRSFDARERDGYDDAIEDYKNRVSKATKLDLPKVDIHKRRELFEKEQKEEVVNTSTAASKLGTEIVSIKDRISSLRNNLATSTVSTAPPKKLELPTTTKLKDRLSSLQQVSSPVDEPKKNPLDTQFKNVQEVKNEFEMKAKADDNESLGSTDREDSGIQTTDVSCAVSQADEHTEHIEEFHEKLESLNLESEVPKDEPEAVDDESSVSCSDDDQTHSVLVLNLGEATNKAAKTPNDAILEFIQSNLIDEHQQMIDNNYVYEFIINRSEHQLEKSNSIDTALSLCSSSDGQSLMDDADDKSHR